MVSEDSALLILSLPLCHHMMSMAKGFPLAVKMF